MAVPFDALCVCRPSSSDRTIGGRRLICNAWRAPPSPPSADGFELSLLRSIIGVHQVSNRRRTHDAVMLRTPALSSKLEMRDRESLQTVLPPAESRLRPLCAQTSLDFQADFLNAVFSNGKIASEGSV